MLKVAIVGFGVMGRNHYRVLSGIDGVKVIAVCDKDAKLPVETNNYKAVDQLLSKEKVDAAVIAVPTFLHREVSLKFIKRGINLLIEKPVADTVEDSQIILDAAQKKNIKVAVGYIERFNPVVQTLKQEIMDKDIFSINITRVGPFPPRISDVGILTDLAVHDMDLIRYITGKEIIKRVIYKSQTIHNHGEDNAIVSLKLENFIVASITTNWLTPYKKRRIEVACREGFYEADLMSQELHMFSSYSEDSNSFLTRACFVKKGEPLLRELESFVSYIKDDSKVNLATIEDSIRTLELVKV